MAKDAILCYLEALRKDGEEIPLGSDEEPGGELLAFMPRLPHGLKEAVERDEPLAGEKLVDLLDQPWLAAVRSLPRAGPKKAELSLPEGLRLWRWFWLWLWLWLWLLEVYWRFSHPRSLLPVGQTARCPPGPTVSAVRHHSQSP